MEKRSNIYDTDFFLWCNEQSALVLNSETKGMDKENIAEELGSMGRSDKRALSSYLEIIVMHMLKLEAQPDYENKKGWERSIRNCRRRALKLVRESPSLKRTFEDVLREVFPDAREDASEETGIDLSKIRDRPFTIEEVLGGTEK